MGKLIVIEGTDGSGKSTQFRQLMEHLQKDSIDFKCLQFPRYQEESSALIRMYLDGQFGTKPTDVNAFAASAFYAVDRYASYKQDWGNYYEEGGLILSDRYTTSNAVHQASKLQGKERADYLDWLYEFEYDKLALPRPDLMIFCNTKHMCQRLSDDFRRAGADCDCIHGDIRQSQREKTMQKYREGKLTILIATDVASRGIDVDDVDCVVNFDVPEENEYYVHRIGRTGRAKRKGVAWSVIGNFPEKAKLDEIAKFSEYKIKPMVLDAEGNLTEEIVKPVAPPKRRFR